MVARSKTEPAGEPAAAMMRLLTVKQAAALLAISERKLFELLASKAILRVKMAAPCELTLPI